MDLTLHVKIERGTEVETDHTCDYTFMLVSIFEIGCAIWSSFHWVPHDVSVHGQCWKLKFNIVVEWQVANLPETNLLDLGFWALIQQSMVK